MDVDAIIAGLSAAQRVVLPAIGEDYWVGFAYIADDTLLPIGEVKRAVCELHKTGLLDYGHLVREDDGAIAGKGYWPSALGAHVRKSLRDDAEAWSRFSFTLMQLADPFFAPAAVRSALIERAAK